MQELVEVPRTQFTTSGGDVAEDQFCQDMDAAIAPVKVLNCNQDFVKVNVLLSQQLDAGQQSAFDTVVADHTATGRITNGPLADLAPGLFPNDEAFATDGRKVGEGPGAGTGVPVWWSNGQWLNYGTDTVAQA